MLDRVIGGEDEKPDGGAMRNSRVER